MRFQTASTFILLFLLWQCGRFREACVLSADRQGGIVFVSRYIKEAAFCKTFFFN